MVSSQLGKVFHLMIYYHPNIKPVKRQVIILCIEGSQKQLYGTTFTTKKKIS